MNAINQALRLLKINIVLFRHGLDEIIMRTPLFQSVRFLLYLTPSYWLRRNDQTSRGARIRQSLEELGPIFVKFGQILSTRKDLLPPDIALELAKLQDRVPPFPIDQAKKIIEDSLGCEISTIFSEFEDKPLASASIAQVHAAKLKSGHDVVVKVVRPGISKTIRQDVDLLITFAELAERYWSEAKRLHPKEVVDEFEKNLFDELDLLREAANASQLRRQFSTSNSLYVPEIHWDYCHTNVIVMERIYGIPINDIETLSAKNFDLKRLAERGVEIFFTQVFKHSFFHADMHPGNIFVSTENPSDPQYIAIDFGIMGSLDPKDQNYLAQNFLAFFNRDYRKVAELHVESEWVPRHTRIDEFEAAIRTVCEPIFERPLSEISFGGLLLRLFQTARRFQMEVQPQLVLLQKTLLNIEGLGRQLYPELDLWSTAKPFLENWMSEQVGVRAIGNKLKKNLPELAQWLPDMPILIKRQLVENIEAARIQKQHTTELRRLNQHIQILQERVFYFALASAVAGGAVILVIAKPVQMSHIMGLPWLSWILLGLAGTLLAKSWPRKLKRFG